MTSTIKVNNIQNYNKQQNQDGGNTLTVRWIGEMVDTLASGASQTGFGRTGTVDWQTTIKTSTFTAVNGEGYFRYIKWCFYNVNLPAGSAGDIVSIKDYARNFNNNNFTITPNGSEKIGGKCSKM